MTIDSIVDAKSQVLNFLYFEFSKFIRDLRIVENHQNNLNIANEAVIDSYLHHLLKAYIDLLD